MNTIRPTFVLRASRPAYRRIQRVPRRTYAADPPPHPPSTPPNSNHKEPSRVGTFYKSFSYPVLKSFLGALFTYQLAYYLWLKLEVVEEKFEKQGEIEGLKEELKDAVIEQKAKAKGVVEKVEGKVEGVREEGKKKGWLSW